MERYWVELGGEAVSVDLSDEGGRVRAVVDGREYHLESLHVGRDALSLRHGTLSYFVHVAPEDDQVHLRIRGDQYLATVRSDREWHLLHLAGGGGAAAKAAGTLQAPMPGKVLAVKVAAGDLVEAGAALVILEAMKMENELRAPARARVAEVLVEAGEAVEGGAPLVRFEPPEAGEAA